MKNKPKSCHQAVSNHRLIDQFKFSQSRTGKCDCKGTEDFLAMIKRPLIEDRLKVPQDRENLRIN